MDYREVDGRVEETGLAEQSYLWSRDHPVLIDAAVAAVQKYGWSRAQVSVPERPGIKGGLQQTWWGVGVIALPDRCKVWHCLDVPGYGLGGFLGHYWTNEATIERWNADLFVSQALTMTELTGVLMVEDLAPLPANSARRNPGHRVRVCEFRSEFGSAGPVRDLDGHTPEPVLAPAAEMPGFEAAGNAETRYTP